MRCSEKQLFQMIDQSVASVRPLHEHTIEEEREGGDRKTSE